MQGLLEVDPSLIVLLFADLELGVSRLHVSALIVVRPTCDQCDELLLSFPLLFHVGVGEEGGHLRVAQDLLRLAELEVEQSETMRDAEVRRFASGASDFFLVNIREETAANALIRYHLADLERHVAIV